jgi:hypothetical protein
MTQDVLKTERQYLRNNQKRLRREYPGRFLLITDETVHGDYETYDEGVMAGVERFPNGPPFLVRSVDDVDDPVLHNPALVLGVPLSCPS